MNYNSDDPRITAYLFDELAPAERAEFEAALSASGELRELIDGTRATIEMVRADLGGQTPLQLSDQQRATVRAHVSSGASSPSNREADVLAAAGQQRPMPHGRSPAWMA